MPIDGYFDVVFAESGDLTTVPDNTQPDGSVSYEQGYGIDYQLDPGSDPAALLVERTKFNYIMNAATSAIQQYQQHGTPPFITSAMNGGTPYSYSKYDRVLYSGTVYQSLVNSNTDTPPTANWVVADIGVTPALTGDVTGTVSGATISTTIASNVVDNTKLAQMTAYSVKANATSATASATDLALSSNQLLGRAAGNIVGISVGTNEIVGRAGSNLTTIAVGTNEVPVRAAGNLTTVALTSGTILGNTGSGVAAIPLSTLNNYLISSTVVSSPQANVDITLPSGYSYYRLEIENFIPSTNSTIMYVRFRTLGGSVRTGSSDYTYISFISDLGGSPGATTSGTAGQIAWTTSNGYNISTSSAAKSLDADLYIKNAYNSSVYTKISGKVDYFDTLPSLAQALVVGNVNTAESNDLVRFLMNSGNIASGTFNLYGYL